MPGHPRLSCCQMSKDVDARDKPGHDEVLTAAVPLPRTIRLVRRARCNPLHAALDDGVAGGGGGEKFDQGPSGLGLLRNRGDPCRKHRDAVSNCINRWKLVPERVDRGGTLRYAWLRAPPLRHAIKPNPSPSLGRLTQKAPYGGGQSHRIARLRWRAHHRSTKMAGTAQAPFAHPTKLREAKGAVDG